MVHILDVFEYIIKKRETITDNPSIMIYVNKMENRIRFNIKSGYYLELSMLENMELIGTSKSKR